MCKKYSNDIVYQHRFLVYLTVLDYGVFQKISNNSLVRNHFIIKSNFNNFRVICICITNLTISRIFDISSANPEIACSTPFIELKIPSTHQKHPAPKTATSLLMPFQFLFISIKKGSNLSEPFYYFYTNWKAVSSFTSPITNVL